VDVRYAPQASNNISHTARTQNPPATMANQAHSLANSSTITGSQNPISVSTTSSNTPIPAATQGWFNQGQTHQGGMTGLFILGYPWAPGHLLPSYPQNLNQWYPYHPGQYTPQQVTGSQVSTSTMRNKKSTVRNKIMQTKIYIISIKHSPESTQLFM